MGHKDLLVTRTYRSCRKLSRVRTRSVCRKASFKRGYRPAPLTSSRLGVPTTRFGRVSKPTSQRGGVGTLHPPVDCDRDAVLVFHQVGNERAQCPQRSVWRSRATGSREVRHIRMAADKFKTKRQKISGHHVE